MKVKRGIIIEGNKIQWRHYQYPIVTKVSNGWNYNTNDMNVGSEVKFKVVHKSAGVNEVKGTNKNELCAELI